MDNLRVWRIAAVNLVVGTGWVFFEWLFFVTKPSFMSLYTLAEKFSVLAVTSLIVSFLLLLGSLPFYAAAVLAGRMGWNPVVRSAIAFLLASLLASLAMLVLFDNFTLTLFGVGIRDASGVPLYLYRLLTVELLVFSFWFLHGFVDGRHTPLTLKALTTASAVILLSSFPLLWVTSTSWTGSRDTPAVTAVSKPNIIILASDGLVAGRMSLYGYERSTTPFLERVSDEFLISDNHFTNASDTGGAVISLLTGKMPTSTRVIYPPDSLRGKDSFEHLPGLLRRLGYYTADVSMRHYADPYDLNLRDGFFRANFRELKKKTGGTLVTFLRENPMLNPASQLLDRMSERVSERFEHIWKNVRMPNPLAEVNRPDEQWIRDPRRMEEIRNILENAERPFFLNVHMMGTHGEVFRPRKRVYSTDDDYPNKWSVDGYDDAVMDFDRYVEETYTLLQELDLLNSTILVISSDHGIKHNALDRLPMLLRLPGQEKTGRIAGNTQRLDIAPTLLDAMGIDAPVWMEGASMLSRDFGADPSRKVLAFGSQSDKTANGNFWSLRTSVAPWYSLGRVFLVVCDQGFVWNLDSMEIQGDLIAGSNMDCEGHMTLDEAEGIMADHLREKGYSWE